MYVPDTHYGVFAPNISNEHSDTLMFERILAGPKPWYFGHVQLPGGTENLGKEGFGLAWRHASLSGARKRRETGERPGELPMDVRFDRDDDDRDQPAAPVVGTLMQIQSFERLKDGGLTLVVQAVERLAVLDAKQEVPYSIATVALLPDDEACAAHEDKARSGVEYYLESRARTALGNNNQNPFRSSHSNEDGGGTSKCPSREEEFLVSTLARAAAVAESERWRAFEFGLYERSAADQDVPPIAHFDRFALPEKYRTLGTSLELDMHSTSSADHSPPVWSDEWVKHVLDTVRDTARLYEGGPGVSDEVAPTAAKIQPSFSSASSSSIPVNNNPFRSVSPTSSSSYGVGAPVQQKTKVAVAGPTDVRTDLLQAKLLSTLPPSKLHADAVFLLEYRIWCAIDTMLRLLGELQPSEKSTSTSKSGDSFPLADGKTFPLPLQLLSLVPARPPMSLISVEKGLVEPPTSLSPATATPVGGGAASKDDSASGGSKVEAVWPVGFYFHLIANQMLDRGVGVKSQMRMEFVSVGGLEVEPSDPNDPEEEKCYPPLRRARRLSFVAAALLDGFDENASGASRNNPRQRLLEITSTDGRLQIILKRIDTINRILRNHVDTRKRR